MFRTDSAHEVYPFPFPMDETRFWESVEITSRSSLLLLECDDVDAAGQSRTYLVSPGAMETLLGVPSIRIRQLALMAPDHMEPSNYWRFAAISELWSCMAKFGPHSAKGWLFVLDDGAEIDTFGLGAGSIERVVQVFGGTGTIEIIGGHQQGVYCGV